MLATRILCLQITDLERLTAVMENYLNEHNVVSKNPMSLVMFQFAIEHVSRIARVLRQDSGHALLIGMGGSGRASCSRLAVFMAGYELCQLEMSRSYGLEQWRDDLKRILMKAGGEGKPTVFLFTDTQIKDEAFIEVGLSGLCEFSPFQNLRQVHIFLF